MDINDVYQGDFLKAADLKGQEHTVVIATIQLKDYDEGKKILLTFQHRKKSLVLNKTNAKRIAFAHGNNTDGWIGREIVLYPDLVEYQGQTVEAIRVRPAARQPATNRPGVAVERKNGVEMSTGTSDHPNAPGNDSQSQGGGFHDDPIPFAPDRH